MEDVSSDDSEIPIPLNSTITSYGHGGHMIRQDNPTASAAAAVASGVATSNHHRVIPRPLMVHTSLQDHHFVSSSYNNKKQQPVKYKECLKNHAAAIGGNAIDGCGEFMPSGEEATIEALTCSACHCHRNFHRKQVEEDHNNFYHNISNINTHHLNRVGRRVIFGGHHKSGNLIGYPTTHPVPHQMIMSYNIGGGLGSVPSESDEQEGGVVGVGQTHNSKTQLLRKRFRTKFTHEQKEKMFSFAEKVGWKIQKQEAAVVQQLCHEIGVKRRVLKVWMHNNKHNLAKHNPSGTTIPLKKN